MMIPIIPPWTYPDARYYYDWLDKTPPEAEVEPSDGDIKSAVVDRLKTNTYTKHDDIKVDVKQGVVVLGGEVSSWLVKRAAGDDAWDTPGVVDVSNQLRPQQRNLTTE
jgi:osmotically-inducible protein OsmY